MRFSRRTVVTGMAFVLVALAIWAWLYVAGGAPQGAAASWAGVDVTVIEKFAAEAGREARAPFINTDQGDLLLFVFALGGAVGGFVAGYCWRRLVSEKPGNGRTNRAPDAHNNE